MKPDKTKARTKTTLRPRPAPRKDIGLDISVREASQLWLDFFIGICSSTSPDPGELEPHTELGFQSRRKWLEHAAMLADDALDLYESRWAKGRVK